MAFLSRAISNLFRSTGCTQASPTNIQHAKEPSTSHESNKHLLEQCFDFNANACETVLESSLSDSFEFVSNELSFSLGGFSKDDVVHLADLADQAYLPSSKLISNEANVQQLQEAGAMQAFESYASRGFVLARGKELTVAFKGTSTLYDVFATDLFALPAFPSRDLLPEGAFVHAGFLAAFETTWQQLEAIIQSHREVERITITGHSLGGALATIAALYIHRHLLQRTPTREGASSLAKKIRLCTFGSPRVLSSKAADYFNDVLGLGGRTLRVAQNDFDPITMVAPGSFGFRHVGVNLAIEKELVVPHVMTGYKAGVARLVAASFVPNYYVGVRRRLLHACRSLGHLVH